MMIRLLSLPVIVLLLTVIVATPARAQPPDLPQPYSPFLVSRDFTFGMVGLAPGQTARLNVVNVESVNNAALPCRLSLGFFDDSGKILKQSVVQVDGAKAVFLDLTWEETAKRAGASNTNRIQIRAVGYNQLLALPPSAPQPAIPIAFSCNVIPTVELFTSETGISSVVLTDSVSLNRIVPPLQLAGPAARVRTGPGYRRWQQRNTEELPVGSEKKILETKPNPVLGRKGTLWRAEKSRVFDYAPFAASQDLYGPIQELWVNVFRRYLARWATLQYWLIRPAV